MMNSALMAVLESAVAASLAYKASGPPKRDRLERFAALHQLTVTAENGPMIISYLRTTRRWRAGGFVAGLVVYLAINVTRGGLGVGIEFGYPFLGWYVGVMIAETRLPRPTGRDRRLATLLSGPATWLSTAAMAGCVLALLMAVLAVSDGIQGTVSLQEIGLSLAVAVTLLSGLLQRRIAALPTLRGPSTVVAAELAVRSRSLHVLAAGALVFLVTAASVTMSGSGTDRPGLTVDLPGLLFLGLLALAWYTATRPWPIRLVRPSG